ncbi:MAG: ATP-binding protein [Gammaproteobacteria bacterium]|nr:ATP-binding protein [Gammaproteobacteria bacterium]
MDILFDIHNSHLEDPSRFAERDPQLHRLQLLPYRYVPALLQQFPTNIPGIYTLGGGRQIGKTTLLKQWMQQLLHQGVQPAAIVFLSGEMIDDQHSLLRILRSQLDTMPVTGIKYILLDEVSYIRDWDKAVKYAADSGLLDQVILMLTGSDLVLMQEARMRFPGRRGQADQVDFHLYPLSFRETVILKRANTPALESAKNDQMVLALPMLYEEFEQYLIHGGYLTAINDYATNNKITAATLMTYSDWVRGDMLKRGKHEHYLREILSAIIKRYMTQVSWNALARDLSIDHPKTVADYIALLESMDAVFVQAALLEDKLCAAPKKARKVMFADPFIFHAISAWLQSQQGRFVDQIAETLKKPEICAALVESIVVTHYRRFYQTYYIKAEGEVDVAYIDNGQFWPVEIKWRGQLHTKDLKQILKYPNGKILTRFHESRMIGHLPAEPLPWALWKMDHPLH